MLEKVLPVLFSTHTQKLYVTAELSHSLNLCHIFYTGFLTSQISPHFLTLSLHSFIQKLTNNIRKTNSSLFQAHYIKWGKWC